jgi:hypothetical protein
LIIGGSYWGLAIETKHRLALNVDGQPKGA